MQIFVKQHATETGDISFDTPAIDVDGMPLLVFELIVYRIAGGGSESITAQLQSSNDLQSWDNVASADVTLNAAGQDRDIAHITTRPYGKYVNFTIGIATGVTEIEYSLVLNTYASS